MNKNVLVTGGTRGMGEAIVKEFAQNGYNIIINYVKSNKKAISLKSEIEREYKVKVLLIQADLSYEDEINKMVKTALHKNLGE